MRDPAAGIVVAAIVGMALLVAWIVPGLAPFATWPILFLIPGLAIVTWARPPIAATGRLGLAIVLSVAISTHVVYWLALATGGYQRATTFAALAILAAPLPAAAWLAGRSFLARQLASAGRAVRRNVVPFGMAALTAAFVAMVLWLSLWRPTPDGGVSAGGSNWSDLPVHLAIAQSLNAGNFPPQVPFFAGAPLVYHWFADFHAAIAAGAAQSFAIPAFVVGSSVLAGALALVVHGLARHFIHGAGARRAALLAVVLVIFGGGLGWIRLIADVATGVGDPLALVAHNSYDNSWFDAAHGEAAWPYFRIPSVMGTGLLVHRATTAGLPMLAGSILLLVAGLPPRRAMEAGARDRPVLIGLAGLLGALLAPFHFFFFPAVLLLALLYVALAGRLLEADAPRNAAVFLAPYLLALPFAVAPLLQAGASGAIRLVAGWESAPTGEGLPAVLFFYVTNLGVPAVLAVVALLSRGTRWRVFAGAWALALFVVPNVVQAGHIAFDMNKYFQAMWIAVALLAGWLMRRWPMPAIAGVLLLSIPSPLLVAAWTVAGQNQMLRAADLAAAEWISTHSPQRTVFVSDGWLHAPTDPAGRLRLLTFTPYVENLGLDAHRRELQLHEIYCGGRQSRSLATMRELGAGYLIESGLPSECLTPTAFHPTDQFQPVFAFEAVTIWQLTDDAGAASVSSRR